VLPAAALLISRTQEKIMNKKIILGPAVAAFAFAGVAIAQLASAGAKDRLSGRL
jgi:hypothetical protein